MKAQIFTIDVVYKSLVESAVVPPPKPKVTKFKKIPSPKKVVGRPGLHKETRNVISGGKSQTRTVWMGMPKPPTEAKIAGHAAKPTSPNTHQHSHY